MRIPNIICENTFKTYLLTHQDSIIVHRRLKSENYSWDENAIKSLKYLCLETIQTNWKDYPLYDELKFIADRQILCEILSCDLPLALTVPIITDDFYWKKRYEHFWPNSPRPVMYIKDIEQFYHSTLPPIPHFESNEEEEEEKEQIVEDNIHATDLEQKENDIEGKEGLVDKKENVSIKKGNKFFRRVNNVIKTVNSFDKKRNGLNKNDENNNGDHLNNNSSRKGSNKNSSAKNSIKSSLSVHSAPKTSSNSPKTLPNSPKGSNSPQPAKSSKNSLKSPKTVQNSPITPQSPKPTPHSPHSPKTSPNSPKSTSNPKSPIHSPNSKSKSPKATSPSPKPNSSKQSPPTPKPSSSPKISRKSSKNSPGTPQLPIIPPEQSPKPPKTPTSPKPSNKSSENASKLSTKRNSKSSIKVESVSSNGLLRKESICVIPRKLSTPSRKSSSAGVDDSKKVDVQEEEAGVFMEVPLVKSWKTCYLERHFQEILQDMEPTRFNQEIIRELIELIGDYVYSLKLKSLKAAEPSDEVPLQSNDHIPLDMIVGFLPNLFELSLCFNEMGLGDNFSWDKTKISERDCKLLGQGLEKSDLKIFRILKSNVDGGKLELFIRPLLKNTNLKILDLSHCVVGDAGVEVIVSGLRQYPGLESLILVNNKIGVVGAECLGGYLKELRVKPGLVNLNMKLNEIKDEGFNYVCDALIHGGRTLKSICLAGCGLEGKTNNFFRMLNRNNTLEKIDLSNNDLGTEFADMLIDRILTNRTVVHVDLRMCNICAERRAKIDLILQENWAKRRGQISRPVVIFEMPYSML